MLIWDKGEGRMSKKLIKFVRGLYNIYDHILGEFEMTASFRCSVNGLDCFLFFQVNATDNKKRDSTMSTIRISIDQSKNSIYMWSAGRGIPVVRM